MGTQGFDIRTYSELLTCILDLFRPEMHGDLRLGRYYSPFDYWYMALRRGLITSQEYDTNVQGMLEARTPVAG